MSCLALAIAVKGEWDVVQLVDELRLAGVPINAEVHIACDPQFVPANPPQSLSIHCAPGASLFELWGLAISASTASWVAVLHVDAPPAPGWFAAMTREIEREGWSDGYWGPVEPRPRISSDRMLGYLTEYCQFHRPLESGLREVPGSNLILPRERFGESKTFSKTSLLQEGLSPRFLEDAAALYARRNRFGEYCRRRFRHARAYAATRSPRLSLLQAVPLSIALPFVRTGRVLRHAFRLKKLRGAGLRLLPAIFLAETCWSAGEFVGYLTRRPGNLAALD